jgi:hypothetical protein
MDQLLDARLLDDVVLVGRGDVLHPADRLVGDAQGAEDVVVEVLVTEEQLVHPPQELAGLRALDDAVVVGGGQGHDLADPEPGQRVRRRPLVLRRVVHRADADDGALPLHQSRDGVNGADRARVGEADGGREVVGRELVAARAAYDVLVGRPELREVHLVRAHDGGHEERAAAVGLLHVDGEAEVDVLGLRDGGLAVDLGEAVVHLGHRAQGPHDREPDQVGERHLAAATALEVVVDDRAVVDEQLGRNRADAGGCRHGEACLHVADDTGGRALERDRLPRRGSRRRRALLPRGLARLLDRRRRSRGAGRGGLALAYGVPVRPPTVGRGGGVGWGHLVAGRCGARRGRCLLGRGGLRRAAVGGGRRAVLRLVVLEEVPPRPVHGLRVLEVLLVDLVDQPLVGAEDGE